MTEVKVGRFDAIYGKLYGKLTEIKNADSTKKGLVRQKCLESERKGHVTCKDGIIFAAKAQCWDT